VLVCARLSLIWVRVYALVAAKKRGGEREQGVVGRDSFYSSQVEVRFFLLHAIWSSFMHGEKSEQTEEMHAC
jgi:hypothetical protein